MLRGELVRILAQGRGYFPDRTHVILLDEPHYQLTTLTFDPADLETEDAEPILSVKDVWPDADADGMRDEIRRQWPQLADALDRECGLKA